MYSNMNSNSLAYLKRTYFFIALIILFFIISTAKLVEYQIVRSHELTKNANNKNKTWQIVPAARGDIVDRYGVVLATNGLNLSLVIDSAFPVATAKDDKLTRQSKNIEGNNILLNLIRILENNGLNYDQNFPITKTSPHKFIEDKKSEENKLKAALNQQPYASPDDILNLLVEKYDIKGYNESDTVKIATMRSNMLLSNFAQSKVFTVIDSIDPEFVEQFIGTTINLKGINIAETSKRQYPCQDVGAHIVGNVGPIYEQEMEKFKSKNYKADAIIGKYGIEKEYEDYLRPFDGFLTIEKLKSGKVNKYFEEDQKPQPGKTIRLTIDFEFQKRIQEALAERIKTISSAPQKGGAVVVLDPSNGEVLAAISLPSYDLNTYSENFQELANSKYTLLNQAFKGSFRPGSAIKIVMAAMALYTGAITPSFKCKCVPWAIFPHMTCMQDKHKGTHTIDIYSALRWSCNNYFYNVAKILGIDKIDEMAPYFGYGVDTGLELPNIEGKVTNPAEFAKRGVPYTQGFTFQTGIGQAETYGSPLQMAISAMVVGNKGKRYAAHIVKSIENFKDNEIIFETKPQILSELDSNNDAWEIVKKGMMEMANSRPPLSKFHGKIATKSGSPQYSDANRKLSNAAGVGFYPAIENSSKPPEIAFGIMVHDARFAVDFLGDIAAIWEDLKKERAQNKQQ